MKRTFKLTGVVSSHTPFTSGHLRLLVLQKMLSYHISQWLPTTDSKTTPHYLLLDVLGSAPNSSQEMLQDNIRCLLQQLHPDKNLFIPPTTSQYMPLVTTAKSFLNKNLRPIYPCCGLPGVTRYKKRSLYMFPLQPIPSTAEQLHGFIDFYLYSQNANQKNQCSVTITISTIISS